MRAEIIAIGDELTSGVRLDTNSRWLSQQLEQSGVPVAYHTTVGDQLDALVDVLRVAMQRAHVVVTSGGLGPTADDLTRQALSEATGRSLILDEDVLAQIRQLFARRGRTMPRRNVIQVQFPEESRVIPNPHGTAPGIQMHLQRDAAPPCHLFSLPGVPAELRQMWTDSVIFELDRLLGAGRGVIRHRMIRCFGAGESDIEQRLPDLIRRGRDPSVGITASQATITLRVTAHGQTSDACRAAMEPTVATIYECLGPLVYGEDDDELQDAVMDMLQQRRQTLASIEWGTEGLVAAWLASAARKAGCYRGGLVIAHANGWQSALGDCESPADDALQDGPASVAQMANAARDQFQTDFGLAVGPAPKESPLGEDPEHILFAVATPQKLVNGSSVFAAHPSIQCQRSAKQALNFLRLTLLERWPRPPS